MRIEHAISRPPTAANGSVNPPIYQRCYNFIGSHHLSHKHKDGEEYKVELSKRHHVRQRKLQNSVWICLVLWLTSRKRKCRKAREYCQYLSHRLYIFLVR